MKVALVHELLTMKGGAERVLKILGTMFPDAPIYTLLYDEKKLGDWFPKERIITAKYPTHYSLLAPHFPNHHLYLTQFPKAVEKWDFFDYDLVISTSSAFAHGIITNGKPKHLSYINSPARYLWDRTHDVVNQAGKGLLGPIKRKYLEHIFHKLRIWDSEAAARPDKLLAASKEVQRRIELYWRRESEVVYPPIDDFWLDRLSGSGSGSGLASSPNPNPTTESNYYLVVSTLVPYKRIDLAIAACNKGKRKLKIVGEGPDRKRLEELAGATIEFLGYTPRDELKSLYTNARATIFPGDEDFGLVPLESMACGTPVIAFKKGGALETLTEGETGEFFRKPTADSLLEAIEKFEGKIYEIENLRSNAQQFSRKRFETQIQEQIEKIQN